MMRSVRVVPAILTDNPTSLGQMVSGANSFATYVQIDIMDGLFVPSSSIGAHDLQTADIRFEWEAHLMVEQPRGDLEAFKEIGARRVIFHLESRSDPEETVRKAKSIGLEIGLALNPETAVAEALPLLGKVDSVLLMTVHPGYYGSEFIPEVLAKVGQVREARADLEIGVDGGIKEDNLLRVVRSGVDMVCVGSAIFHSPDPAASLSRLSELARHAWPS